MTESTSTSMVGNRTAMDYKKRVCRAMNFISRNLDRDLSLYEIAAAAAFSNEIEGIMVVAVTISAGRHSFVGGGAL